MVRDLLIIENNTNYPVKVGDLVRVQYPIEKQWYTGVIIDVPKKEDPLSVLQMWCIERQSVHILSLRRDNIEILNER